MGPQPQPPRKNWFLRHKILTGVLTVIVPFVIIVIAAGVSGGTHVTPTAAGPSAPKDTTQNAGEPSSAPSSALSSAPTGSIGTTFTVTSSDGTSCAVTLDQVTQRAALPP